MEIDYDLYAQAMKQALRVEFLSSSEELKLYAGALYSAKIWGREVDERNNQINNPNNINNVPTD